MLVTLELHPNASIGAVFLIALKIAYKLGISVDATYGVDQTDILIPFGMKVNIQPGFGRQVERSRDIWDYNTIKVYNS
jgi:uncharacterized membrane protein